MIDEQLYSWSRLVLILLFALVACQDGSPVRPMRDAGVTVDAAPGPEHFAGRVLSDSREPVPGATVSIEGQTTETGDDGGFRLSLERATRYRIQVRKHGHVSKSIVHTGPGASDLEFRLIRAEVFPVDPTQDTDISDSRGTRVELPANSIVDQDGQPVTAPVELHMHTFDPVTEPLVGQASGLDPDTGQEVLLHSVGGFSAVLTDAGGGAYQLGQDARITLPDVGELPAGEDVQPWVYDEAQDMFVRAGTAVLDGNALTIDVPHFSTYSLSWKNGQGPACIALEVAPDAVPPGGSLAVRVFVPSPRPSVQELALSTGEHVFYNLAPNTDVEVYIPSSASTPYAVVSSGDPWGDAGLPPNPGQQCQGTPLTIAGADGLISGAVQLAGRLEHGLVPILFWSDAGAIAATRHSEQAGAYDAFVAGGRYDVFMHGPPGWLDARIPGISVTAGHTTQLPCVRLVRGDMNDDNRIDRDDVDWVVFHEDVADAPPHLDINEDGVIDEADRILVEIMVAENRGVIGPTGPEDPRSQCLAPTPTSCQDILTFVGQVASGVYQVDPDGAGGPMPAMDVYCDMERDGGGWTLGLVKNSIHDGMYADFAAAYTNTEQLLAPPEDASRTTATDPIAAWLDLNTFPYTTLKIAAYHNGNETYRSQPIARSALRIPFGQDGYYLFKDANGYYWCGGDKQFTDNGVGQVNQPAGANADCKNHGVLGSGWDFSEFSGRVNRGLTTCGADGQRWMMPEWGDVTQRVYYPVPGAAQAIWVR